MFAIYMQQKLGTCSRPEELFEAFSLRTDGAALIYKRVSLEHGMGSGL